MSCFLIFFRKHVGKYFSRRSHRTVPEHDDSLVEPDGSEPNTSLDNPTEPNPNQPTTFTIGPPVNDQSIEDVVNVIEELVSSSIFAPESEKSSAEGAEPQSQNQIRFDGSNKEEPLLISLTESQHADTPEQGIDFSTVEENREAEPEIPPSPGIQSQANQSFLHGTVQPLLDDIENSLCNPYPDPFSDDFTLNVVPTERYPHSKNNQETRTVPQLRCVLASATVQCDQVSKLNLDTEQELYAELPVHTETIIQSSEQISQIAHNQPAAIRRSLPNVKPSTEENVAVTKQVTKSSTHSGSTKDMVSGSDRTAPSPKLSQLPGNSTSLRNYLESTSVRRASPSPVNTKQVAEKKSASSIPRTPPKQTVTTEKTVVRGPPSPRPSTPSTPKRRYEPAAKDTAKEPEECPHNQEPPTTPPEDVSLVSLTEVGDSTKEVLETAMRKFGMKEMTTEGYWNVRWSDNGIPIHLFQKLLKYQRINRFPGSGLLMTKNNLAKNTSKMKQTFPEDYDFVPETWCLPGDFTRVELYAKAHDQDCFIVKPNDGSSGRGIIITRNVAKLKSCDKMVCQVYIRRPFLIDGYKFDLRIYTLITSCRPLRLFVYNEGLARFATEKYHQPNQQNESNRYMHLTNYAVNKRSPFYTVDETKGTLRRLSTINKWLARHGVDSKKVWDSMDEAIVKTIISFLPALRHYYKVSFPDQSDSNSCFQIVGFDIIFDEKLKPFVLEVNDSPSFKADVPLDKEMTDALIHDTFNILHLNENNRSKVMMEEKRQSRMRLMSTTQNRTHLHKEKERSQRLLTQSRIEWENGHMGNFRKVFPNESKMKHYKKFIRAAHEIFQHHPW